jgi:hypothetical protein
MYSKATRFFILKWVSYLLEVYRQKRIKKAINHGNKLWDKKLKGLK